MKVVTAILFLLAGAACQVSILIGAALLSWGFALIVAGALGLFDLWLWERQ